MSHLDVDPFPEINTQRLFLRQLKSTDDEAIFRIRSSEIVYKYIDKQPQKNIEESQEFITKKNKSIANGEIFYWGIVLKEKDELVGVICFWNFSKDKLTAELGYELYPDYHRKGIMNEAIEGVIDFGFKFLGLKSIEAFTHKNNEGSKKLLQRHHFKLEVGRTDEGFPNNIVYVLTG
jgi:ribosomal-protein-alanine N-acetyltransferase